MILFNIQKTICFVTFYSALVKKRVLCLSVLLVQNIVFLYVFLLNFFNRILWLLNVQKTS